MTYGDMCFHLSKAWDLGVGFVQYSWRLNTWSTMVGPTVHMAPAYAGARTYMGLSHLTPGHAFGRAADPIAACTRKPAELRQCTPKKRSIGRKSTATPNACTLHPLPVCGFKPCNARCAVLTTAKAPAGPAALGSVTTGIYTGCVATW